MFEEDRKKQKETFAAMNGKEKVFYIWEYYKMAVIAAAAVLVILVYAVATPGEPKIETSANVTFIGEWINQDEADSFTMELNKELTELSDGTRSIDVQSYSLGETADPMMVMGNIQKLAASMTSGDLDVIVGSESQLQKYAGGGAFLPIADLFTPDEREALNIISYEYTPVLEDGSKQETYEVEYIDLSGKAAMAAIVPSEKIGMALMTTSLRTEEARIIMDYLLKLE